jgi:hypothetical protein
MDAKQINKALTDFYWPPQLDSDRAYITTHDDNDGDPLSGFMSLIFDQCGDAHLQVTGRSLRFRTMGGGGRFPKIRNALLLLAVAIKEEGVWLDGEEK